MRRGWLFGLAILFGGACTQGPASPNAPLGDGDLGDQGSIGADVAGDGHTTPGDTNTHSCDSMAAACASQFGALFTNTNGRADGTLVALVRPTDTQCAMPNSTHAVLQLSILGQIQRLVVNVDGVLTSQASAALVGPAFAEGWHENVPLDYPGDLGSHSADFTAATRDEAVAFLCSHLELGAPVAVYAYSDGTEPSSAHQIHRNNGYPDGAVAVQPTSATPTYLLFRFSDQVF